MIAKAVPTPEASNCTEPETQQVPRSEPEAKPEKTPRPSNKSKQWRQDRFEVWLRDDFRCQYCDADLLASYQGIMSLTVDHVIPRHESYDDSPSNLVTCWAFIAFVDATVRASLNRIAEEEQQRTAMRREPRPGLFRVKGAAAYLSVSPTYFSDRIRPHIPEINLNGMPRFKRSDLDTYIDSLG